MGKPRGGRRIVRASNVATVVQADRVLVVDVFDAGRYVALNVVAGMVWSLIADGPTLAVVLERMRREYGDEDRGGLTEDVAAALNDLEARGLITWY